jgi:hypothetical protein
MKGRVFIAICLFVLLPVAGVSQQLTFDAARQTQSIINFNTEMTETYNQIDLFLRQVDKTGKILENWKKAREKLEVVSEYVGRVEDIAEVYGMIEETINTLVYGKEVIMDENYLDVNRKLRYINNLVSMSTSNINRLQEMLRKYAKGSKSSGNMTDAERIEDKENDIGAAENCINSMKNEIAKAKMEAENEKRNKGSFVSSMSVIGGVY